MSTMVYKWRNGARAPVAPQLAGETIEKLAEENQQVTPTDLREASRPQEAPLHPCFEWDDLIAAEMYRLDQARYILRNLIVVVEQEEKEPREIRAFVNVTNRGKEEEDEIEQAYVTIKRAMSEIELRQQVILRALREAESWERRYTDYVELGPILAGIREVRQALVNAQV